MKVSLEIQMGGAAMLCWDDVTEALQKVSRHIMYDLNPEDAPRFSDGEYRIKDRNGNTVGVMLVEATSEYEEQEDEPGFALEPEDD